MADKEYVEREALLKEFDECEPQNWTNSDAEIQADFDYQWFRRIVTEAKTADVVEVVRCRYCKYHHWEQEPCHGKTEHFCSVLNAQVFADFYCYHGAKMDGKGEGE